MKTKNIIALLSAVGLSQFAGVIGSIFTSSSISTWYATLQKPELTPPGWIFGPVWITLYFLMGIAAYLVWKRNNKKALIIFGVQLILNSLWSIIFFGLQNPGLALLEIIILWIAILWTMIAFWKIDRRAGVLFVPYIAWVSFAAYLNYSIWTLN